MKRKLLYALLAFVFTASTAILSACSSAESNGGHMHSLVHHVPIAATCELAGNIEYWSCAGCGKYFSDENAVKEIETAVIPATGHSWSEWETLYPVSCTQNGSESRSCSVCYAYETRTVQASGHDYSDTWKSDEKTHWKECNNCDDKKEIAEHSYTGDSCSVCGYTITYTDALAFTLSDNGSYYIVTGRGNADEAYIFVPAQFAGKPVKSIGVSAFENDAALTDIYLPESVEAIADYAFYGCPNLASVKMQDGLKTIGVQAFKNCESLQDIEISGKLNAVGQRAFENCNALKNVYIRDIAAWCAIQFGGEAPEPSSFDYPFPSNPLSYAQNLYIDNELTTNIIIPKNVTTITGFAFIGFQGAYSVEIGENVETIGDYAFFYCKNLSYVDIGNAVIEIGNYAFYLCNSLINILIPDNVIKIKDSSFSNCQNLEIVSIGEKVEIIETSAFRFCRSLITVTIPNNVQYIGSYAFEGCALKSITLPNSITNIEQGTFAQCHSLTNIIIHDNITSIGDYTFSSCSSLRSVNISNNVTSIGNGVFANCFSLTSITIPSSVTTIGNNAFFGCSSLQNITIPGSVTTIGESAFGDCTSLTEAYFADPYGWRQGYVSGEIIPAEQLSDPQTAAELLKNKNYLEK